MVRDGNRYARHAPRKSSGKSPPTLKCGMFIRPENINLLSTLAALQNTDVDEFLSLAVEIGCEVLRARAGIDDGGESELWGVQVTRGEGAEPLR
jgi:hypothetical protein